MSQKDSSVSVAVEVLNVSQTLKTLEQEITAEFCRRQLVHDKTVEILTRRIEYLEQQVDHLFHKRAISLKKGEK